MEKKSWVPSFFLFLGVISLIILGYFILPYWRYYMLPMSQRPLNPNHSLLRASGYFGLSMGIIGTGLIFLNLSYLIRKSLIQFKWLGELRSWMSFHVFTGIIGSILILFHSAFLPRSALASTAIFGLIVVVLTGLMGRYIYAHTPRSI